MARIAHELREDPHWSEVLAEAPPRAIHLAIFVQPFLGWIVGGQKLVESRFSVRKAAPFRKVATGDIVIVKAAGGPVRGICEVGTTWFFDLLPGVLDGVRREFAERMCATDETFWARCADARHASLMELTSFRPLAPMECPKRDRRGWVVLQEGTSRDAQHGTSRAPGRSRSVRPTW